MRGVYPGCGDPVVGEPGSSPHARGLRDGAIEDLVKEGIIPACAGFTQMLVQRAVWRGDHPRMRGVYHDAVHDLVGMAGSSPHARGLPPCVDRRQDQGGIIPACAGFTGDLAGMAFILRDHPRMRGVYAGSPSAPPPTTGSSPHARGLPGSHRRRRQTPRIIPACAGFTGLGAGVHEELVGIIPACAGFTLRPRSLRPPRRDHPRMRGVYTWRSLESQRSWSLPPPGFLHC